jgi:hypothetical protein
MSQISTPLMLFSGQSLSFLLANATSLMDSAESQTKLPDSSAPLNHARHNPAVDPNPQSSGIEISEDCCLAVNAVMLSSEIFTR